MEKYQTTHLSTAVKRACIVLVTAATMPAVAQTAFPATLAGHAVMPAMSLIKAPADAPADLQTSGKFTTGQRVEKSAPSRANRPVAQLVCFCHSRANPCKAIRASNTWPTAATGS